MHLSERNPVLNTGDETMTSISNFSATDLAREYLRNTFDRDDLDSIAWLHDLQKNRVISADGTTALGAAARIASGTEAIDEPTEDDESFVDEVESAIAEEINAYADEIAHHLACEIKSRAARITSGETTDDNLAEAFDSVIGSTCCDSWGADVVRAVANCADVLAEDRA